MMGRPGAGYLAAAAATALAGVVTTAAAADARVPPYLAVREVPLPGDEGWDYLTFEQGGQRLFVSHGTRVQVIDTDKLVVGGEIADTPGVHGIALAAELGRGYISAGRAGLIVVFDLKTLARLKEIRTTGDNPDAILYDGSTQRVFSFNGRGRNATAVDARSNEVIGSIALDAKPEFAVADGSGRIYVNLEDRNSLAVIDARELKVLAVHPISGCEDPSGLAIDRAGRRLFPVCANKIMAVMDADSGRVLSSAPIGGGVDAAAFDPGTGLAFASCGSGVLTVVSVSAAGALKVVQSLPTRRGARTMALDERRHRVYLVTADFGPAPAPSAAQPQPRPALLPGSFRLLIGEARAPAGAALGDP